MKKKLLYMIFVAGMFSGISQPPPPHPGGSGNSGASIPISVLVLTAFTSCLVYRNKSIK